LSSQCSKERLDQHDSGHIDEDQRRGERTVDERAVYQEVDVVEAIPQDGDAGGDRDGGEGRDPEEEHHVLNESWDCLRQHERDDKARRHDRCCIDDPLQLQPLPAPRPPKTGDHRNNRDEDGDRHYPVAGTPQNLDEAPHFSPDA
jgi:hypothetical protein